MVCIVMTVYPTKPPTDKTYQYLHVFFRDVEVEYVTVLYDPLLLHGLRNAHKSMLKAPTNQQLSCRLVVPGSTTRLVMNSKINTNLIEAHLRERERKREGGGGGYMYILLCYVD